MHQRGSGTTSYRRDGGRITAPRRYKTRNKVETSGKRHWIQADENYIFLLRSFLDQVKNDVTGVKKVKIVALQDQGVFFCGIFPPSDLQWEVRKSASSQVMVITNIYVFCSVLYWYLLPAVHNSRNYEIVQINYIYLPTCLRAQG